jgi:hypothetical protein
VVQRAKSGAKVQRSVSSEQHAKAWKFQGGEPPVPVAFDMDGITYVDMDHWPPDLPPPEFH